MVRNRIVAALLATLPLAACEVSENELPAGTQKAEELELGDVRSALAAFAQVEVVGAHEDQVPYMLSGQLGQASAATGFAAVNAHSRVAQALPNIAAAFRLKASDLAPTRITVDEQDNTHIRYAQMKNGLRVIGGEFIVHMDKDGRIYSANSSARDGESVSAKAKIAPEAAEAAALGNTLGRHLELEQKAELVYLRQDGKLKLAYQVLVAGEGADLPVREYVYVSANDAKVLDRASLIHSAMNRAVYHGNNTTSLPGTLRRSEGGAATGDAHIDMNYDHLGTTYQCYFQNFGRDSYNGAGAQMRSTVHHSTNYVNAFWNGSQMVYGDGDGTQSGMLGKDLDVTVHELTHAVTSSESNLTYSNESGALNEGMSDIFAAYCESWTRSWSTDADVWKIGEDIWTPATSGDALRYMANPTQDGSSKDYYPERYTGTSDNGGVHWNSGIANLAFQLLSTGGTHPRGKTTTAVTGIGVQQAGAIFYRANRDLFTASTNFAQAKTYTEQAATALGYSAASVTQAWQAVGVGVAAPPPTGTALSNGVAITGISGAASSQKFYYLDVPAGKAVTFAMSGGTGDADLYVKFGAQAGTTSGNYDCRPYISGNNETCNMPAKTTAGRYSVLIQGYSSYSSTSIKGSYTP
ncbi:MAG TPA: M4 family metallopeptidase [Myxococcaceae bacterium]